MREIPLLCRDEVVRAYLAGRKTQTRRPVQLPKKWGDQVDHRDLEASGFWCVEPGLPSRQWQYGDDRLPQQFHAGDRAWIRETWAADRCYNDKKPIDIPHGRQIYYGSQVIPNWHKVRPSIHMPRWAARIVLPVVSVRVERVRDITEADAIAEGLEPLPTGPIPEGRDGRDGTEIYPGESAVEQYLDLWLALYGAKYPPETAWCWVIETEPYQGARA